MLGSALAVVRPCLHPDHAPDMLSVVLGHDDEEPLGVLVAPRPHLVRRRKGTTSAGEVGGLPHSDARPELIVSSETDPDHAMSLSEPLPG